MGTLVDRLEELLEQMADENDEEQEDALALEAERVSTAASAHKIEDGIESPEDFEHREGPERGENGAVPVPVEKGESWAAVPPAGGKYRPEDGKPPSAHENELTAPRTPGTGDGRMIMEGDTGAASAPGAAVEQGLEELYRRTAQAAHPTVQNLPVEQAGRTLRAEEPGRTAALTVDELDRAVRRDSRRYDGGITIF